MKKNILTLISLLVLFSSINITYAKTNNTELANAIKLYKNGNYSQCYYSLNDIIKKDPSNALAHYYMGMTYAQLGKKEEAIASYDSALSLTSKINNLSRYAQKGKRCLETPDKCNSVLPENIEEQFILNKNGSKFSDSVKNDYERLRI